jgi:uncharacterized protein YecE (DUF72 family)
MQRLDVSANGRRRAIAIGTAGWSIPTQRADDFPGAGSHLQRYASHFRAVEINSSFYRSHKPATYARWASHTPAGFRFAVKAPREITHLRRLVDAIASLEQFLTEIAALGDRLGPLLIQLPPSLRFDAHVAEGFLDALRDRFTGLVVCEPRHPSWLAAEADRLLTQYEVARVRADPPLTPTAATPGGSPAIAYHRLHGSPKVYYSAYTAAQLHALAIQLRNAHARETWCIFDNTALGEAIDNAATLQDVLRSLGDPALDVSRDGPALRSNASDI